MDSTTPSAMASGADSSVPVARSAQTSSTGQIATSDVASTTCGRQRVRHESDRQLTACPGSLGMR